MSIIKSKAKSVDKDMSPNSGMAKPESSLSVALSTQRMSVPKKKMAHGGPVEPSDLMDEDERAGSIAEAIMRKRKMMAEGGMVDLNENSEELGNEADELNMDALGKEQYDLDQLSPQPEDSNEHGDDIESDKHDMVAQIRSKLKSKRGI